MSDTDRLEDAFLPWLPDYDGSEIDDFERMKEVCDAVVYNRWFREQLLHAMDDARPRLSNKTVSAHFAERRRKVKI